MREQIRMRWRAAAAGLRDASVVGRAQAAAWAALVAVVVGTFAYGAVTDRGGADAERAGLLPRAPAATGATRPQPLLPAAGHRRRPAALRAGRGPAQVSEGRAVRAQPTPAVHRRRAAHRRPHHGVPAPDAPQPGGDTPLVVGVLYQPASLTARLLEALGLHEKPGDTTAQAQAVAAWISAHGGIGGRRLDVRPVAFDPTTDAPFAQACSALLGGTLQPVAVVAPADDAAGQTACLADHGVTLVGDAPAVGDAQVFANAGDRLFAPGSMALDRLAGVYGRVLAREGFLDGRSRAGILRLDEPMFERADRLALRPALAAAGIKVVAQATLRRPRLLADVPGALSDMALAVLRFRLAGVDRVLALDDGVAAPLFMRAAELLRYRPRYGLNSTMAPAALEGGVPRAQLAGAFGIGFAPLLDVSAGHEPEPPAGRRRCEEIYRDAGVDPGPRTVAGKYAAIATCDAIFTVRAGLERAREKTAASLPRALAALGADQPSALALASGLSPARHDGALAVRPLRFDDACTCLQYAGPEEVVP